MEAINVPSEEVQPRGDEPVDRGLFPLRTSILQYLINFFTRMKLIRDIFLILYPNQPASLPGQSVGYHYRLPRTGCREQHLKHAKTQAGRLSMIALFLRTMETISSLDQAYSRNPNQLQRKVSEMEKHFRHGLAYLNFMILGVLGNRCIQDILDLLRILKKSKKNCQRCTLEKLSWKEPIMILLVYIADTCDSCSSGLVRELRKTLAIDLQTVKNNHDVVRSCKQCEDMLLGIFLHTKLISFKKCNIRMMASLQITLNPAAIRSQYFKKVDRTMKRRHYYSPSKGVYEVLFLSGWREEKDKKENVLVKKFLEQSGSQAFMINDRYQTVEQGERCCCEDQAWKNISKMPQCFFKICASVRLVLESAPCDTCAQDILPKMKHYFHQSLPTKLLIHKKIVIDVRPRNRRPSKTRQVYMCREISTFTVYALLEYRSRSTYPDRLYAPTDPCDRLNGGTILLRHGSDYDKRFTCLWRNCPEMCCRPDNCKYTHHESILETTHIITVNIRGLIPYIEMSIQNRLGITCAWLSIILH